MSEQALIAAQQAAETLARFADKLQPILERGGTHTLFDVMDGFLRGEYQFFEHRDALVICQINQYPQCKECFIFLAAGTMEGIEALVPAVRRWAEAEKCHRVAFHGRRGWARTFAAKLGATPKWECMEVDLTHGLEQREKHIDHHNVD